MPTAKVIVTGRLVRDVEQASASAPYKSAIAVDGVVKDGSEYKTKFFNINIWPGRENGRGRTQALDLIEAMSAKGKTLTKGSMVQVIGTLSYETYTDKDTGQARMSDAIHVAELEFIPIGTSQNTQKTDEVSDSGVNQSGQGGLTLDDEEIPLL